MARVLVNVPKLVRRDEPFEIRVLISHPMESGQRRGMEGEAIPRMIINHFTCTLGGEPVITLDLHSAIAANPFFSFSAVARESGALVMTWVDDTGVVQSQTEALTVA